MTTQVRPYYYTGTASCPTGEMTDQQCLFPDNLPVDLPQVWSVVAENETFAVGAQVFSSNELYVCVTAHTKTSTSLTPESDSNNWRPVGRPLGTLTGQYNNGNTQATPIAPEGISNLRFQLMVNDTTTTGISVTESSGVGTVAINLDTDDFAGSVGADSVGRDQILFDSGVTPRENEVLQLTSGNAFRTVAVSTITGGFNTAGRGLADEGSNTVGLDLYPQKVALFMGTTDGVARTSAAPIAGAMRTYNTFTTQRVPYYFITGISIDESESFVAGGSGVWTTDDPAVVVNPANSANLVG